MMRGQSSDLTYHAVCSWLGGNHTRTETTWQLGEEAFEQRVAPYVIDADLPPAFTGSDYAAAPFEYLLHAVAASLINTVLRRAERDDVVLDELKVESHRAPFADSAGALELKVCVRPLDSGIRRLVEDAVEAAPVLRALRRNVDLTFA